MLYKDLLRTGEKLVLRNRIDFLLNLQRVLPERFRQVAFVEEQIRISVCHISHAPYHALRSAAQNSEQPWGLVSDGSDVLFGSQFTVPELLFNYFVSYRKSFRVLWIIAVNGDERQNGNVEKPLLLCVSPFEPGCLRPPRVANQ